jgi:hypothetical protein
MWSVSIQHLSPKNMIETQIIEATTVWLNLILVVPMFL